MGLFNNTPKDQIILSRKELYELVWAEPMLTLSKKYAVSDIGLRKICIRLNIPLPKSGHWQRVQYGKKIKLISLPEHDGEQSVTLKLRDSDTEHVVGEPTPFKILAKEIEDQLGSNLIVSEKLNKPNDLVVQLKNNLKEQSADRWNYIGSVHSNRGYLDTRVSVENVVRSLRFWDVLIKCLHLRGHEVIIKNEETRLVVGGFDFKCLLRERTKKEVYNDGGNWDRTRYNPTGNLYFQAYYSSKEWKDGKIRLEDQLSKIIAHLELAAKERMEWQEESNRREAERKEKERIQKELELRKEKDLSEFKETLQKATRWHKVVNLRKYINEIESKAVASNSHSTELKEWIEWVRKKADWYDPFIEAYDELLMDIDKETLSFIKKTTPYGF